MLSTIAFLVSALFYSSVNSLPFTGNPNIFQCTYPGDPGSFTCSLDLPDFPRVIGDAPVWLYQFGDQAKSSDVAKRLLQLISDASDAVLPTYSTLASLSDVSIEMYLVERFAPGTTIDGETKWIPAGAGSPARCAIRYPLDKLTGPADDYVKLVVAHELYHCVESAGNKPPSGGPQPRIEGWWREGVAEFFGNYFYPEKDPDSNIRKYDPVIPLYGQDYPASAFFQYLNNAGWNEIQINNWLLNQQLSLDMASERTRVSQDSDVRTQFPKFATRFVDKSIVYHDGSPIDFITPVQPTIFLVNIPKGGSPVTLTLRGEPFTISQRTVNIGPKQTILLKVTSIPTDSKIQYRKTGSTDWSELSAGSSTQLQDACITETVSYDFVFTSTADTDTEGVDVQFVRLTRKGKRDDDEDNQCKDDPDPSACSLPGTWSLDISSLQSFIQQKLTTQEKSVTLSNFAVTGSSTFTVNDDLSSTMVFDHLTIGYDAAAIPAGALPNWHSDIDVTGSIAGTLKLLGATGGDPEFTWGDGSVITGEAKTNTVIAGIGSLPFNIPMDQQYGSATTVSYSCAGSQLLLTGNVGGKYAWAYSYSKA
ncbi:MAG: hypothetical protein M1839_006000 [Geoglossum umbratile]|nr:MAG: hypothetical protein M1839_006000 [Geoglossum umbratile]